MLMPQKTMRGSQTCNSDPSELSGRIIEAIIDKTATTMPKRVAFQGWRNRFEAKCWKLARMPKQGPDTEVLAISCNDNWCYLEIQDHIPSYTIFFLGIFAQKASFVGSINHALFQWNSETSLSISKNRDFLKHLKIGYNPKSSIFIRCSIINPPLG